MLLSKNKITASLLGLLLVSFAFVTSSACAAEIEKAQFIGLAGLKVAVWNNGDESGKKPLIIFSHGFHGRNTQTGFLMSAMAKAGYIVMAPDHDDASAIGAPNPGLPEVPFRLAAKWNEQTYRKRGLDIQNLIAALRKSQEWNARIDWSKVGLCGHSLGGYTVLALSGGWPSWKLPGVKAVLALSPYCGPFNVHDTLSGIDIPIMYQGGTKDFGITPSISRKNGAFAKSNKPAYFVDFDGIGHMGWTAYNQDLKSQELIDYYSIAFLDKYVKGESNINLSEKRVGVAALETK